MDQKSPMERSKADFAVILEVFGRSSKKYEILMLTKWPKQIEKSGSKIAQGAPRDHEGTETVPLLAPWVPGAAPFRAQEPVGK